MILCAATVFAACGCSGDRDGGKNAPAPTPDQPEKTDPQPEPEPEPAAELTLRLGTYNVGVFSKSGTNTTEMVAQMMKEIGVDVLSMNELDYMNGRHNVNQIQEFALKMGNWKYNFAPALLSYRNGQYGVGIAWKPELKFVKMDKMTLAQGDGAEQRALAIVEFEDFVFLSTHLDHKSAAAQLNQAKIIDAWAEKNYGATRKPVFVCGDFNALPESATIQFMKGNWTILSPLQPTYSAKSPSKCIDYIMVYKNAADRVKTGEAKVPTVFKSGDVTVASDHLPVYVDVTISR